MTQILYLLTNQHGALDSETSIQVMDLLKEVAKDRLVVMVTHNPELAENYATRIVNIKAGKWPSNYNECVLVLTSQGNISDFLLYALGLRDYSELDKFVTQFSNGEDVNTPDSFGSYSYDDILGITFKLINSSDCYEYDEEYKIWRDKTDNTEYMRNVVENGEDLKQQQLF